VSGVQTPPRGARALLYVLAPTLFLLVPLLAWFDLLWLVPPVAFVGVPLGLLVPAAGARRGRSPR
jgi:hypothetical protein